MQNPVLGAMRPSVAMVLAFLLTVSAAMVAGGSELPAAEHAPEVPPQEVARFDDTVPESSTPSGPSFVQISAEDGEMLSLKVEASGKMTSGSRANTQTPVCKYEQCKCIGKNYRGAKTGKGAKCTMHGHKKKW